MDRIPNSDATHGFEWGDDQRQRIALLKRRRETGPALGPEQVVVLDAISSSERVNLSSLRNAITEMRRTAASGEAAPDRFIPVTSPISAILIKPVGDACNLRCTYCYEGEDNERIRLPRMSEATLESIIRDTLIQATSEMNFIWHGGEPTLAGIDFLRQGMAFQKRHNSRGVPISNSIQTNGTLLNQGWMEFFREFNFSVGVSLDGPEDVHDYYRVGKQYQGSYKDVVTGIELLKQNDIPFGVITVITDQSKVRARDIFHAFRGLGIKTFDAHPSFGMHLQGDRGPLHPKDYSRFAIELFETWLASGEEGIRILLFDDIVRAMLGQSIKTCYFAGSCSRIMGFEPNGDATPCTRPFDRVRYTFGNMQKQTLTTILESPKFVTFKDEDLRSQINSHDCPWFHMCHNGCPQHRAKAGRQDVSGANLYCQCQSGIEGGHAVIWDHVTRRINRILFPVMSADADGAELRHEKTV